MKRYIAIDGGTTNTRVFLTEDEKIISSVKIPIGARKNIDGTAALKSALRDAISDLLSAAGISESDITAVIASGMITSEFGLINLPHLVAPAGTAVLHRGITPKSVPEVTRLEINFIPGVKTVGELEFTDMMRGEETELMGIYSPEYGECIFVLPGSHSKIIRTDGCGRITTFSTTLTGEMLASLSEGTILRDAVSLDCGKIDEESLFAGYEYAHAHGLNEALFKTRILKNIFAKSPVACYSFFLGAVLADEIDTIAKSEAKTVVIGGKKQIKLATVSLIEHYLDKRVITLTDSEVDTSTVRGMIKIFNSK